MTRVEILIGSPRRNGNTAFLCRRLHELLAGGGAESRVCFLDDHEIRPCIDCRACKRPPMSCAIEDGARLLHRRMEEADAVVFATPIYWYAPSAQTKLLIDRLRPYYASRRLAGKRAAVILAAGSGASDCDLTAEMFARIFAALGMVSAGSVLTAAYDIGDAARDLPAIGRLGGMAQSLLAPPPGDQ